MKEMKTNLAERVKSASRKIVQWKNRVSIGSYVGADREPSVAWYGTLNRGNSRIRIEENNMLSVTSNG